MVFNLFSKSGPIDAKVGFAHKVNTDVYSDAQDLITRHIKMIYAELNEDLKNGSRGTDLKSLSMPFPCLSEPDPLQHDPRQQSSIYTHQYPPHAQPQSQPQHSYIRPSTGPWDPAFPGAWVPEIRVKSQSGYQDDCDGQDTVKDGGDPRGHIGPALQESNTLDTTTLSFSEGLSDIAQETAPGVERGRAQSAAQRDATRKTPESRLQKDLPPMPSGTRANANSGLVDKFTREEPSGSHPRQTSFQSRNQADEKTRRTQSEPFPHNEKHDPTSPDSPNQEISVNNLPLKEVVIRILHWIEACQKRLKGFPGETIANFRHALAAIPPEIKLEERYLLQLIKLARRLERFYWRIMRHEDFEYIQSACGSAQPRVEAWSQNLRSPPSEKHVKHGVRDPANRKIRES